jgi:hypothetical protein
LTDAELDIVAGGSASAVVEAVNVTAFGQISLSSTPSAASADVNIFNFNNVGAATPQVLAVGLVTMAP